ncbi:MAG: flagellar protein FlgN [Clostridiaceae bacterium]|nr:flagellar protein FlgN [Clostridiaceae bacterium]
MIDAIWVDNLIKVFEYERRLYAQILEEAENKTDVIVKGDVNSLQETVLREQSIIKELDKLRDVREQIIAQISRKTGKKPEEITVSYLAEIFPEDKAKRLTEIRDSLKETIERLKLKNDINQKLLNNALDYVNFSLNLMMQPSPQATQYGSKGTEKQVSGRNVLDIKY